MLQEQYSIDPLFLLKIRMRHWSYIVQFKFSGPALNFTEKKNSLSLAYKQWSFYLCHIVSCFVSSWDRYRTFTVLSMYCITCRCKQFQRSGQNVQRCHHTWWHSWTTSLPPCIPCRSSAVPLQRSIQRASLPRHTPLVYTNRNIGRWVEPFWSTINNFKL